MTSSGLYLGRVALRVEWLAIVDRMCDRLTPGADGKKKRFTGTLTENAREFIQLFRDRDFTNDRELRGLLDRADGLLSGVDAEILRSDDVARARTAQGFQALRAERDRMVPTAGRVYGDDL